MRDTKFDLNDIVLIPSETSEIYSRKQCKIDVPFNGGFRIPLMAAPMDTVVSEENYSKFIKNGIIPCIPRGVENCNKDNKHLFKSYSLSEIEDQLFHSAQNPNHFSNYPNVLIDIANGHMKRLLDVVKEVKKKFPKLILMVGNVANPETYVNLGMAGADFVRCSVGTGAGCTTAANVSINYPLGSLISECATLKRQYKLETKIVADGGMKNFSDIIKALALGADYVMMGSTFNKTIESAGFNYLWGIKINNKMAETLWKWHFPIKKKYRGMSTKSVQRNWGKTTLVTAEGITKYQSVEYTLSQWTENFKDYLRSAMSYCDAKTLEDFIGKAQYIFISDAARKRFEK